MAAEIGEPRHKRFLAGDDSSTSSATDNAGAGTSVEQHPSLSQSFSFPSPVDRERKPPPTEYDFNILQSTSCDSFVYDSYSSSTADFDNFDLDLPYRWYKRAWSFIMCITGLFDILAYMEPKLRHWYNDGSICVPANFTNTSDFIEFGDGVSNLLVNLDTGPPSPWYCSRYMTFLNRLHDYNVVIAFVFSLLWFKQSHTKAKEEYHYNATVKEDRIQLLSPTTIETRSSSSNDSNSNQKSRWSQVKCMKMYNPSFVYYRRIILRMALLPVGFYIILFQLIRGLMNGKWLYRELLIDQPANETAYLLLQDPKEYVTIEVSRAHAKMSTIFAIFLYLKYHFLSVTAVAKAELDTHYIPQLRRKLVIRAFRNPRNFIRQLKTVLKYVRWIKYIIPLVVKLNKLRGNTMAALRKRRQFTKAKKEAKRQRLLQKSIVKTTSQLEDSAAILIQRVWRAYRNYMHHRVLKHFQSNKKLNAAMKIQLVFRRASLRAQIKLARKRTELQRLIWLNQRKIKKLDDDERRRLYELQDEFMTEATNTINKRLLMRPNTWFSVSWNSLFLFCILVEISHNALRPWLVIPKGQQINNQKYKSMRMFFAESLIPIPIEETPACKEFLKKKSAIRRLFFRKDHCERPTRKEVMSAFIDEIIDPEYDLEQLRGDTNNTSKPVVPWQCSDPVLTWRNNWRTIVRLVFSPNPISESPSCQQPEKTLVDIVITRFHQKIDRPTPWYCTKPYSSIHDFYRSTWNFVIDQIQIVISVICFLDVFVKFFTGEIDPNTGELRPRPFFRRWIFPGLLLQLLVNPAIETFSVGFFRCMGLGMEIGPVRVFRWCIAVAVPIAYASKKITIAALHEAEAEYDRELAQYGMMFSDYSY